MSEGRTTCLGLRLPESGRAFFSCARACACACVAWCLCAFWCWGHSSSWCRGSSVCPITIYCYALGVLILSNSLSPSAALFPEGAFVFVCRCRYTWVSAIQGIFVALRSYPAEVLLILSWGFSSSSKWRSLFFLTGRLYIFMRSLSVRGLRRCHAKAYRSSESSLCWSYSFLSW